MCIVSVLYFFFKFIYFPYFIPLLCHFSFVFFTFFHTILFFHFSFIFSFSLRFHFSLPLLSFIFSFRSKADRGFTQHFALWIWIGWILFYLLFLIFLPILIMYFPTILCGIVLLMVLSALTPVSDSYQPKVCNSGFCVLLMFLTYILTYVLICIFIYIFCLHLYFKFLLITIFFYVYNSGE